MATPQEFRIVGAQAAIHQINTRMPFRYGNACLTASPVLTVEVEIETSAGKRSTGLGADCLPPRWFDKDPSKPYEQNVSDQLAAYRTAREVYLEQAKHPATASAHWSNCFPLVVERMAAQNINSLTASFGSSFFERAMIDAICRAQKVSFFDALAGDLLGHSDATSEKGRSSLPAPNFEIGCRHTVGLADPIRGEDIPADERLNDGLPQSLGECIDFYGLRYFKVKVCGDHEKDLERLGAMATLFDERCPSGYQISLDGNEQYRDLSRLETLLDDLKSRPLGKEFVDAIIYIEQPLARDLALDADAASGIRALSEIKPVIIDESDDSPQSFQQAVELGYRGTSHKNCKGVFKSLSNHALCAKLNAESGNANYFLTAEDLANTAVIPLQQDLATIAALGIKHAERNGHHYFRGLDHLPEEEQQQALTSHPDLYTARDGGVFLDVTGGMIHCHSLNQPGYGHTGFTEIAARIPVDEWVFDL